MSDIGADVEAAMRHGSSKTHRTSECKTCPTKNTSLTQKYRRRWKNIHKCSCGNKYVKLVPSFPCRLCDKRYKSEVRRAKHALLDHGIPNFDCCPECGEKINNQNKVVAHFLDHELNDNKQMLFRCPSCPGIRYFLSGDARTAHEIEVHGETRNDKPNCIIM